MSTFDSLETSREDGQPIRLYQFVRGPLRYCYTTADRAVTVNSQTFATCQISDNGVSFTGQSQADVLTITLPADSEIANMYQGLPPSDEVTCTIWDWHYAADDYIVKYVGTVMSCKYTDAYTAEITVWSLAASLERPGLRLSYQRSCPHALYDNNCKVDEQNYKVTGSIATVSGVTIDVSAASAYPDGWFTAGYVEWELTQGIMERRGITLHAGLTLTILGGVYGLTAGLAVNLYPGCVRTAETCNTKFDNLPNYGGVPMLPGDSPFDGNPVW